jgi:SAM-dependent methyltransferase
VTGGREPYYRQDLALVHHLGFGFHADACAPGILRLLEPVLETHGTVLEIGCGSGLLTKYLVDAGHHVIATDASPAMLHLAREYAPGAAEIDALVLASDPVPPADAIVGVGHALNYLADAGAIERALDALAAALRPGGVLAIDLCDLEWAAVRRDQPSIGRAGTDWAIVTEFSVPAPDRYVRQMAVFVRDADGTWHRDDERHDNVLVPTDEVPRRLARHGVEAEIRDSFGTETLPQGLKAVVGRKLRVSADGD